MKTHISVTGDQDLMKALNSLSERVKKQHLVEGLKEAAEPIRRLMADTVARHDEAPHIADHIGISPVSKIDGIRLHEDEAAVAIGPTRQYFYGWFLELGTVNMTPQPFVKPSFDAEQRSALAKLSGFIWNRLKRGTR